MARVMHLFRAPKRREPMEELQEARALEDVGLDGCAHARPQGKRQVLLMDRETLVYVDLDSAPRLAGLLLGRSGLAVAHRRPPRGRHAERPRPALPKRAAFFLGPGNCRSGRAHESGQARHRQRQRPRPHFGHARHHHLGTDGSDSGSVRVRSHPGSHASRRFRRACLR